MKALVYQGAGKRALVEKPRPTLQAASDAIVQISKTTICGTDLHILRGDVPSVSSGRILGHEGVGVIVEAGASMSSFVVGDRVVISCISSCGKCPHCKSGMYSHCQNGGGWILGNQIDGTQAEYVRVPFADNSLYKIPAGADEEALVMLSDILPTAYECGVLSGQVKPGDSVLVVGAGPIGLAALLTAQFFAPAEIFVIDSDPNRLAVASELGASRVIDNTGGRAAEAVMELTGGRGVDVAMEAIGVGASFEICQAVVTAGGRIANIGVHGAAVLLHLEKLWSENVTLTTRLVDTVSTPMLLKTVMSGRIAPRSLITHHFTLSEATKAYDIFGDAMHERALKVIITNAD